VLAVMVWPRAVPDGRFDGGAERGIAAEIEAHRGAIRRQRLDEFDDVKFRRIARAADREVWGRGRRVAAASERGQIGARDALNEAEAEDTWKLAGEIARFDVVSRRSW